MTHTVPPHVSCVMVTQRSRLEYFRRSTADFLRQTHPNKRLLVVTSDQDMGEFRAHLANIPEATFLQLDAPEQLPIGVMRNAALQAAPDGFVCSWDDDDRHHPERLAAHLQPFADPHVIATCLCEQLYHFVHQHELWITQWDGLTPGIIMYRKTELQYENVSRHEDSRYCRQLQRRGRVVAVRGRPELYVRTIHGANVSTLGHHVGIAKQLGLSTPLTTSLRKQLRNAKQVFELPGGMQLRGYMGARLGTLP